MYIVFEGLDNSGKTAIIQKVYQKMLVGGKFNPFLAREPGTTELGEELRRYLKKNKFNDLTRLLMFSANRADIYEKYTHIIEHKTKVLLSDRSFISTFFYQCHEPNTKLLLQLIMNTIKPPTIDKLFFIDVDYESYTRRFNDQQTKPDKIEEELLLTNFDASRKKYLNACYQADFTELNIINNSDSKDLDRNVQIIVQEIHKGI